MPTSPLHVAPAGAAAQEHQIALLAHSLKEREREAEELHRQLAGASGAGAEQSALFQTIVRNAEEENVGLVKKNEALVALLKELEEAPLKLQGMLQESERDNEVLQAKAAGLEAQVAALRAAEAQRDEFKSVADTLGAALREKQQESDARMAQISELTRAFNDLQAENLRLRTGGASAPVATAPSYASQPHFTSPAVQSALAAYQTQTSSPVRLPASTSNTFDIQSRLQRLEIQLGMHQPPVQ
eukprot:TRINITY_DN12509_c0_g2_i1.p1 TRINITY_DN12509_c0_g2~~TRINITY_DN12509_c0_g2_i1.p1  ORF type:complete len:243 (+),score=88.67 TRINITY_DN12509_c0_g2_i1:2-730(+)